MNNTFEKKAGISLIVFTILLVATMVLHPAGGSVEHLIRITGMIVVTHAIAILSLPFGWIGFWGLTQRIGTDRFGSILAFAMVSLGLVAALLAGATNGLALPIFLQSYKDASPETIDVIRPIMRYSFAVNHAFDYVYTGAFCLAILGWSIEILRGRKLPVWIGWLGIILFIAIVILLLSGMAVNHLMGFRIFVASILVWIAIVGVVLWKK